MVRVPVIPLEDCTKSYIKIIPIIDTQVCAGGEVGQDSCGGDSGGPLMKAFSFGAPPRYFIVGVVSFGPKDCAVKPIPGVYTKISDYMLWILDNVKQ